MRSRNEVLKEKRELLKERRQREQRERNEQAMADAKEARQNIPRMRLHADGALFNAPMVARLLPDGVNKSGVVEALEGRHAYDYPLTGVVEFMRAADLVTASNSGQLGTEVMGLYEIAQITGPE